MNKLIKLWLPVFLYAALIFILSSRPVSQKVMLFPYADKVYHFLEYAVLGLLLVRAFINTNPKGSFYKWKIVSVILASLYGVSDEFHQYFVPTRNADVVDLIVDCIGSFLGTAIYRKKQI